jgi:hypothetical protein
MAQDFSFFYMLFQLLGVDQDVKLIIGCNFICFCFQQRVFKNKKLELLVEVLSQPNRHRVDKNFNLVIALPRRFSHEHVSVSGPNLNH